MSTTRAMAVTEAEMISNDIASTHTWLTTTLFCISLFESVFRPDPTSVICLFGFYSAGHRSAPAMRSFATFLTLTIVVDVLWFLNFMPFAEPSFSAFLDISRSEQLALILSLVSVLYKLIILPVSVRLYRAFNAEQSSEEDPTQGGTNGDLLAPHFFAGKDGQSTPRG